MANSESAPSRRPLSAVISETPISVFQLHPGTPGAPRKSVWFLRRTQVPAPEELANTFSLEPHMRGSWGYLFRYDMGELFMQQSETFDEEKEGPRDPFTTAAPLTSCDWGVLKLFWEEYLSEGFTLE